MQKQDVELFPQKDETDPNSFDTVALNPAQPSTSNDVVLDDTAWSSEKLERMQDDLAHFTDSMKQYPSFFDKATALWAKCPWWLQLLVVVPLIAVPLALGIVFSIWALVVISIALFLIDVAFNFFFYNHNTQQTKTTDSIHSELNKLATNLDNQMTKLDLQHQEIARETEEMQKENATLALELNALEEQTILFNKQLDEFKNTSGELSKNNAELALTVEGLEGCNDEKIAQLKIYQGMIEQLKYDREQNNSSLEQQISRLNEEQNNFDKTLEMEANLLHTLRKTAEKFKTLVIPDEKTRIMFQNKLNSFFIEKDSTMSRIAERMLESKKELLVLKEQLQLIKHRRSALLERHKAVIDRLETTAKPSSHGFFARDNEPVEGDCGQILDFINTV